MPKKRVKAGTSKAAAAQRRALFIEAYVSNGGNATEAAVTAGFSKKSADQQGCRLLKDVRVSAEIARRGAEARAKAEAETGLSLERTLREVARLSYSDPRKLFKPDGTMLPVHEWPDDVAATVASVETDEISAGDAVIGQSRKIKLWDKNSALDKAMKHFGGYEADNEQSKPMVVPQFEVVLVRPGKDGG